MRPDGLTTGPLELSHVPEFLSLAEMEGWICEPWEFDFLLASFPQGCRVVVADDTAAGFVTAVKYEQSGWVGNLLVREELRGRGLGRLLMEEALTALEAAGAGTTWLTASPSGQPLYEELGFRGIDRIFRWRGSGKYGSDATTTSPWSRAAMEKTDLMGWGDRRRLILEAVAGRGKVVCDTDGFCVLQATGDGWQLGPWGCRSRKAAARLFESAVAAGGPNSAGIFLDVPAKNRDAADLLKGRGFFPCGETVLMYRGSRPSYRPEYVYALASMGSMG